MARKPVAFVDQWAWRVFVVAFYIGLLVVAAVEIFNGP